MGPTPINDTQIPPATPSKVAKLGFWSKKLRNIMKPVKKQFYDFYFLRNCWFSTQIFRKLRQISANLILPDNQLAMGIQSKSNLGLEAKPGGECEEQSPPQTAGFGGGAIISQKKIGTIFPSIFFCSEIW